MHAPAAAALARRLRFAHDATRQPVVQLLRRLQHGLALRVRVHVVAHPDPRRGRAARDLAPELLGHVHLVARPELQTRRNGARGERMRTCAQTCGVRRSQRRHCCGTDHEAKRGCLARGPAQAHQHKQSEWRSRPHPRVRPAGRCNAESTVQATVKYQLSTWSKHPSKSLSPGQSVVCPLPSHPSAYGTPGQPSSADAAAAPRLNRSL